MRITFTVYIIFRYILSCLVWKQPQCVYVRHDSLYTYSYLHAVLSSDKFVYFSSMQGLLSGLVWKDNKHTVIDPPSAERREERGGERAATEIKE